jgi:hypothetical protein
MSDGHAFLHWANGSYSNSPSCDGLFDVGQMRKIAGGRVRGGLLVYDLKRMWGLLDEIVQAIEDKQQAKLS